MSECDNGTHCQCASSATTRRLSWEHVLSVAKQRARDRRGRLARPFYPRACERKAVSWALAARTYAPGLQAFLLETYDCVSYMPLVIFVGTTDDPVADDGLELAGLASEPLRGETRCNADSVHM